MSVECPRGLLRAFYARSTREAAFGENSLHASKAGYIPHLTFRVVTSHVPLPTRHDGAGDLIDPIDRIDGGRSDFGWIGGGGLVCEDAYVRFENATKCQQLDTSGHGQIIIGKE